MHPLELFKYCPKCGSPHFEVNNEKSKRCADCGFVYYFNSSAATVAFILNDKNELLVCRRGKEPAKGTLDLSGGFIDMYETGEEGVAREVLEETGLQVEEAVYQFHAVPAFQLIFPAYPVIFLVTCHILGSYLLRRSLQGTASHQCGHQ